MKSVGEDQKDELISKRLEGWDLKDGTNSIGSKRWDLNKKVIGMGFTFVQFVITIYCQKKNIYSVDEAVREKMYTMGVNTPRM